MIKDIEIILCIPGQWKDRSDIVAALATSSSGEYVFEGTSIVHIPTNEKFEININDKDKKITGSFKAAGQGKLTDAELNNIDKHSFVIYVVGKGGNTTDAEKTMKAGLAFLNAGGHAIKVETSGKAFNKAAWGKIIDDKDDGRFYEAFVVLLRAKDKSVYSCGLQNIGLRDAIADPAIDNKQSAVLLRKFILHLIMDKPEIKSGDSYSIYPKSPAFKITEEQCRLYAKDDLFYNPFGMYRLK